VFFFPTLKKRFVEIAESEGCSNDANSYKSSNLKRLFEDYGQRYPLFISMESLT